MSGMKMAAASFLWWPRLMVLLVAADPSWRNGTFYNELYEYCPFNDFHARASDIAINGTWRPCCGICVSDTTCGKRAPCCPDYDVRPMTSTCTLLMYGNISEDLFDAVKNLEKFYWMVDTCLPEHRDSTLETNCGVRDLVSVTNTTSLRPVLDTETSVIYANQYCADCNNVNTSLVTDAFTPVIRCLANSPAVTVLTSLADMENFLNIGLCYIMFKPTSLDVVYPSTCIPYDITYCNESKQWDVYDETIDIACRSYEQGYTSALTYITYKNIHCYFCNVESAAIFIKEECLDDIFTFGPMTFSAILGADLQQTEGEPSTASNTGCLATQFYDPYKDHCRAILCPLTKTMTNTGCRQHLRSLQEIMWRMSLLWTIEASEILKMTGFEDTIVAYAVAYIQDRFIQPHNDVLELLELYVYVGMASNDSVGVLISCVFLHETDAATGPVMNFIYGYKSTTIDAFVKHNINGTSVKITARFVRVGSWRGRPEIVLYQMSMSVFYRYVSIDRWSYMNTAVTISKILSCDLVLLDASEYNESDDGLLVINGSKLTLSDADYFKDASGVRVCISDYLFEEAKPVSVRQSDRTKRLVSMVLTLLSLLCLGVFLATYLLLTSLQSPTGHLYTSLCVSIIISQALQYFGIDRTSSVQTCKVIGALVHFFALTTPLLMQVCSFHVRRPMRVLNLGLTGCCSKRRLVPCCLLYTALAAGVIVALHMTVSLLQTNMADLGYGGTTCEITRTSGRYYFLLLPIAIVLLGNTVVLLFDLLRATSVNDSDQSNDPRTKFYSKSLLVLSLLAAVYWVCQGLYWWLGLEVLEYMYLVTDAAQGVCLMVAYFVNQPVLATYGKLFNREKPEEF